MKIPRPISLARVLVAGALISALGHGGCSGSQSAARPADDEVRALLLDVLGPGREARLAERLVVASHPDGDAPLDPGQLVFRPPTEDELATLFLPEPFEDIEVTSMSCRFHPVWKVRFRERRASGPGAPLMVSVAPLGPAQHEPGTPIEWRAILRPWYEVETEQGRRVPDFRPLLRDRREARPGSKEGLSIVIYPPWADPDQS
ncbi:MAG: hypothetical protein JSV80_06440 [Acidobacteriota bacterium]|nr:MAG: hypothetical protein JSV80_06440 [Acidobacteriota bacterium]